MRPRSVAFALAPLVLLLLGGAQPEGPVPELSPTRDGVLRWTGEAPLLAASPEEAEAAARAVLARMPALADRELTLRADKSGLTRRTLRYALSARGLPIFDAELVVQVDGAASAVGSSTPARLRLLHLRRGELPADGSPAQSAERARAVAGDGAGQATLGFAYGRLVWRVAVARPDLLGDIDVDALTGEVLAMSDRRRYASGTGLVFDPSPIASSGDTSLTDESDATYAALEAEQVAVTLENLDGTGVLRGDWVNARTQRAEQRAEEADLVFEYTRDETHFEEVNAYYTIDRLQTWIQSLGFSDVCAKEITVIVDDSRDDNSYYYSSGLFMGTGGVDDAEDGEILAHEYGHAVQDDQAPGLGWGDDASALGEGFGDYLASAMSASLTTAVSDPACVGDWDAISYSRDDPACLRRVDADDHWPEHESPDYYENGSIWASTLWDARDDVGEDLLDSAVLESQFAYASDVTIEEAVEALVEAMAALGPDASDTLRRVLIRHGLSRELSTPSALSEVSATREATLQPELDSRGQYGSLADDTQTVSWPGALALRLHFATIDTETHRSCADEICDNLYLTDASGDLYEILGGAAEDVYSVVIPGDTVNIRLVSDSSQEGAGYVVDWIEAYGEVSGDTGDTGDTGGADTGDTGLVGDTDAEETGDSGEAPGDSDGADEETGDDGGKDTAGGGCSCGTTRSTPRSALVLLALAAWVRARGSRRRYSQSSPARPTPPRR